MGIFGAMTTAVSGLQSQAYALENISGNIANSRTTGFKRVDTSFVDMIPDTPARQELAGSVAGFARPTNTIQGSLNASGVATNMAVNGDGYFVVQERTSFAGGNPVFGGVDLYTRRGDFEVDRNGNLVNGAGYYLKGIKLDPVTGSLIGSKPDIVNISTDNLPAKASTNVEYRANLPTYPKTNAADTAVPGSELLGAGYSADPRTVASGGAGYVAASDETLFLNHSIAGGAVTVYNSAGAPVNVQMRWAKTVSGPPANWNLFYQESTTATGAAPKWRNVGQDYAFSAAGTLTSASSVTLPSLTIDGQTIGPLNLDHGIGGLTQFADSNGQTQVNGLKQDGYASGTLQNVTVGDGGRLVGNYSNGQVVGLAQITLARFNADDALKRRDGGVFEQTLESGEPVLTQAGRELVGGSLEASNTDIADEFSKMIVTQQAYSANTKTLTTAQSMLQDVINIIR